MKNFGKTAVTRRSFIAATTAFAMPHLWIKPAYAAGEVITRSSGGAPEENSRKFIWEPFERETGIRVVPVATTNAKLFAMFKSGNIELDIVDAGNGNVVNFEMQGAFVPIDYASWKSVNPNDIPTEYKSAYRVGMSLYATVLAYNTIMLSEEQRPKSWVEYWDVKRFPGPRGLQDLAAAHANLEFALLADGVPMDKLYPLDLDRAFSSLSRIKPSVPKFWDSGALSIQMLIDREVAMNSLWTSRANPAISAKQPLGYTWNEHIIEYQSIAILKGAKNIENAQRYVEFALRPEIQAAFVQASLSGPINQKAYSHLPKDYAAKVPGSPELREKGFVIDDVWWETNRDEVNRRWTRFLQRG